MAVISTKSEYDKIRDETDRLTEIFRKNEEKKREEEGAGGGVKELILKL